MGPLMISKSAPKPHVLLMRYIWDNFLESVLWKRTPQPDLTLLFANLQYQ